MASFDDDLSRLVRELNSLGGAASLPEVERDVSGRLSLDRLLARVVEAGGSDLLLVAGVSPTARVDGRLIAVDPHRLDAKAIRGLVGEFLDERALGLLERRSAVDTCFDRVGVGRFRANVHHQRGTVAAAIRVFPSSIPDLASLGLPTGLSRFAALERGFVLIAGPAGCGKTTTLASLVQIVNQTRNAHVVTVEDPVEYLHAHGTSVIEHLEVGRDTPSFAEALRHALRQDPDVLVVGEMRDRDAMSVALTAAETGHLVLSTIHTGTVPQTLDRVVDVFPEEGRDQIRAQLSLVLAGIVVQHLVPRAAGRGRVPAVEILVANDAVRNLMRRGLHHQIPAQMVVGRSSGMITLEESLARLVRSGSVSREDAERRATHPDEFSRFLR